ncbi:hypothetical protein [Marinomonas transparens]|uniref:Uncharacterized protein n=1 Tax=Marinomonas transparens TaxID=2795388 RepID=A0A934JN24_9GAMM|nr:hypothetical protein [Marinomonas transparens]MBJ7539250.1 hypothetical protein [Marinomonas transparens]
MGSRSNSSNSTTNNVANYSLNGIETGGAVVAGNDNTVYTTDHGAVEGAFDFASEQSGQAFGFGDSALEFAGNVVDSNEDVTKYALDKNSDLAGQTIGFAADAIEGANETTQSGFEFAESLVNQNSVNAANSTLAIKDLANSLATGGSSDVIEGSTKMVYTIGAVLAVVMLGFVVMIGSRKA